MIPKCDIAMTIKAIKEIKEGSLMNIQANHLLFPLIFAINMNVIAGSAKIAAKIESFSILLFFV
jgi:hypothetical protein